MKPTLPLSVALPVILGLATPSAIAQPPAPAADAGPTLTLREALDRGLRASPDLAISKRSIGAAEAHQRSVGAQRWPSVKLESTVLRWDDELALEIAPGAPPLIAREQITSTSSATAAMLLSHQIPLHLMVKAEKAAVRAARAEHAATTESVAAGIAQTYLGVLLARSQSEIAAARVAAVESQLGRARTLAEAGALKRVDVLRLEAAVAAARREVINAQAAAQSGAEALASLIGLPPGVAVDVTDDLAKQPKPPPVDGRAAEEGALANRDDLVASEARAAQARAGVGAARSALFPAITAIANYTHTTGAGPFQPEDSWYVGLTGSWNIWDWGHNYRLLQETDLRAEQARMAAERARDRARLEARKQVRDARAAFEALGVAGAGAAAADEAYRIQEVRFGEGDTTTTDLLQAETERAQARLAVVAARHAYFVQLALLAQATGRRPDALIEQVR